MPSTRPFLSWGRWVADCGYPDCTNAKIVIPGQTQFLCDAPPDNVDVCLRTSTIVWSDDVGDRMAQVAGLPPQDQSEVVPGSPQDVEP